LDATAEFIAAVYGAGEATRFRQYATDPAAVAAPLTWQARLKADVDTLIKSRPLSPTERARAQPLYEALKRKLAAPSEFDQGLVDSPTGQSFAQFLRDARGAVGDSPFQTLVSPLNDVGGWADLIVPGMDRNFSPTGSTFEERVRSIAAALHRAAETAYKPFLQVALRLTPTTAATAPRANVPSTVGSLLSQCRDAWQRTGGPLGILYDQIEIVRNSEGHVQTEFDFAQNTVSFVNRPDGRPAELVGPWEEQQLVDYARGFLDLVALLSLVYRASLE